METVKLVIGILNGFGITAFVLAIITNFLDWKNLVLVVPGFLFIVARLIVYCIKSYQQIRRENMSYKRDKQRRP